MEEYGIDFRFLLDKLLLEEPKDPMNTRPPPFFPHKEREREPIHTPSSTPIRSRSPAVPNFPAAPSPVPPVPPLPSIVTGSSPRKSSVSSPVSPVARSPASRTASPAPRLTTARSPTPTQANASISGLLRPPRLGSPAPPPRSRERPGSGAGHRPPPVAVPRREGMF